MTEVPKPPQVVHVRWCTTCGNPIIADLKKLSTNKVTCCYCPVGFGHIAVDRYMHAPGKKRGAKKPKRHRQ